MPRLPILFGLTATWLLAIAVGLCVLFDYSNSNGPTGDVPATWPAECPIVRSAGNYTLLMFVHPRCPCSRASVTELAEIMAVCQGKLTATILFYCPADEPNTWAKTILWSRSAAIPAVSVQVDKAGRQAELFGARTSGHALLYDPNGRLVFSGGITAGRGHEGDNPGSSSVMALVRNEQTAQQTALVFGCPLVGGPSIPATSD